MKKFPIRLLLCALPLSVIQLSCKPASLEFIGLKKKSDDEEQKPLQNNGSPPPPPPAASVQQGGNGNGLPKAQVEVIVGGSSSTSVPLNLPVQVRPTADTLDADNASQAANCRNPGIVKVDYDFGDGGKQTVERKNPCDPLELPHTWALPGNYTVNMVVRTDEGETAASSINIVVQSGSQIPLGGNPNQGNPNQGGVRPPVQGSVSPKPTTVPNSCQCTTDGYYYYYYQ